jgi:GST-like protein
MLELYHWEPTAESLAHLIALKEKGLEFKSHYVDMLKLEQHGADYQAKVGGTQVPVLVDGGEVMSDSNLALQYLAEKYPSPRLAPSDPTGWYDLQAFAPALSMGLAGNVRLLGWNQVMLKEMAKADLDALREKLSKIPRRGPQAGWDAVFSDAEASEDALANARERIGKMVERLEKTLAGQAWLVGSDYSITDIQAFSLARTLPSLTPQIVSEEKSPKVMKWLSVIENRPAVQAALAMRKVQGEVYAPPGT